MYIVIGLGNPGRKYAHTRHNAGFDVVEVLSQKKGIALAKLKFQAKIGEGRIAGQRVVLAMPQTYMNLSGESVREIVGFYKPDIQNVLVVYDDVDLPLSRLRIRKSGSAGTHNGMRSIIYQLGRDDFPRIRVGIGGAPQGYDLKDYVLTGFHTKEEREQMFSAYLQAADAACMWIEGGIDRAMQAFNVSPKAEKKAEAKTEARLEAGAEPKDDKGGL